MYSSGGDMWIVGGAVATSNAYLALITQALPFGVRQVLGRYFLLGSHRIVRTRMDEGSDFRFLLNTKETIQVRISTWFSGLCKSG